MECITWAKKEAGLIRGESSETERNSPVGEKGLRRTPPDDKDDNDDDVSIVPTAAVIDKSMMMPSEDPDLSLANLLKTPGQIPKCPFPTREGE